MNELAVTVIGHDRPGIVAEVASALATLGANLTDSTMTRLRGHFAMTLICAGDLTAGVVETALAPVAEGGRLLVEVREIAPDAVPGVSGEPYLLSVHGADRLGIVAEVTSVVAAAGGNITDLSTRLIGPLYVLVAELELGAEVAGAVSDRLAEVAEALGVDVTLRRAEADVL